MALCLLSAAGVLLSATTLSACPFCNSEIGEQVQAGVFNQQFLENVVLTLLPFPVLLLVVVFIHFGLPWPKRTADSPEQQASRN